MTNLPQNTKYNSTEAQNSFTNFPSLKKTLDRYNPDLASGLFDSTRGIAANQPQGTFEVGKPIEAQGEDKFQEIPDYAQFAKADERGFWADPTDQAKIRNFPTNLGGGQYNVDPSQPGSLIKSERVLVNEKINPGVRKALLGKKPSSMFQVDHIVPLWVGGSDTLANLNVLDNATHNRKTAAQSVPLTLLANKKISLNEAKLMAINWEQNDVKGLPAVDDYGYVPLAVAENYAKKWKEDRKKINTSKYFGESFKEEMGKFGEGWLPDPVREFAKGLVGGGTAGIAPGTGASEDSGVTGTVANIAGNIVGTITGLGLLSKGIGATFRGAKSALGFGRAAAIADEALVAANLATDVGNLTAKGISAAKRGDTFNRIVKTAGLLGTWGQLGLTGKDITNQQQVEFKDRTKQALTDIAFGGLLGSAGQTVAGYTRVGLGTAAISMMEGEDIVPSLQNAALMTALHGMGYKQGKVKKDVAIGEEEAYKMAVTTFNEYNGNVIPRMRKGEAIPQKLEFTKERIEQVKKETGNQNITNTEEAIKALGVKSKVQAINNFIDSKGEVPITDFIKTLQRITVSENQILNQTLPIAERRVKTMEDLFSMGEKMRPQINSDEARKALRTSKLLKELPTEFPEQRFENTTGETFLEGPLAITGYGGKIDVNAKQNINDFYKNRGDYSNKLTIVKDPQTASVMRLVEQEQIAKGEKPNVGNPDHALIVYGKKKNGEIVSFGYAPREYKFTREDPYSINKTNFEIEDRIKKIVRDSESPQALRVALSKDKAGIEIDLNKAEGIFNAKKDFEKLSWDKLDAVLKPKNAYERYDKKLNNSAISEEMDKRGVDVLVVEAEKVFPIGEGVPRVNPDNPYLSIRLNEQDWLRSIALKNKKTVSPVSEGIKNVVSKQKADVLTKTVNDVVKKVTPQEKPITFQTEKSVPREIKSGEGDFVENSFKVMKANLENVNLKRYESPEKHEQKLMEIINSFKVKNPGMPKDEFEMALSQAKGRARAFARDEIDRTYRNSEVLNEKTGAEVWKRAPEQSKNPLIKRYNELKRKSEGTSEEDPGMVLKSSEKSEMKQLEKDITEYVRLTNEGNKIKTKVSNEKREYNAKEKEAIKDINDEKLTLTAPYLNKKMYSNVVVAKKYGLELQEPTSYGQQYLKMVNGKPVFTEKFKRETNTDKSPLDFWGSELKKDIDVLQSENTRMSKQVSSEFSEMEKMTKPYPRAVAKTVKEALSRGYGTIYDAGPKKGEIKFPWDNSWRANAAIKAYYNKLANNVFSQPMRRIEAQASGKTAKEIAKFVRDADIKTKATTEETKLRKLDELDRNAISKWGKEDVQYEDLGKMEIKTAEQTRVIDDLTPTDIVMKKLITIPETRSKLISEYNSLRQEMQMSSAKFKAEQYKEMKELFERIKNLSKSFPKEVSKWKLGGKITLPNKGEPTFKDGIEDGLHIAKGIFSTRKTLNPVDYKEVIKKVIESTKQK